MNLLDLPVQQREEMMCRANLGVFNEIRRGFKNAPLHWEWCELAQDTPRLAVVAPRDHAKSEVFTVSQVAWRSIYNPGHQSYVFALTSDLAKKLKARIDEAIAQSAPWMTEGSGRLDNAYESQYANFSSVEVAGAGKAVRGAHPDLIVGDDVLEDETCATHHQREKMNRWWFGVIGGMSHPGQERRLGDGTHVVAFPPTRVHIVGTPFHKADLLLSMSKNPLYHFRRYQAEYEPDELVRGLAVEAS